MTTELEALGIEEVEPWLVEDTLANRKALKEGGFGVQDEWDEDGEPLGLLRVIDPNRQLEANRLRFRWILQNEKDPYSDFVSVMDMDEEQLGLVPHWVVRARNRRIEWLDEMAGAEARGELVRGLGGAGGSEDGAALVAATKSAEEVPEPARCVHVKSDGTRCWGWSPRKKTKNKRGSEDKCRIHAGPPATLTQPLSSVAISRAKLILAAPAMADELIGLAYTAGKDDGVRVRAVTEALDRAGVRATSEVNLNVSGTVEHVDGAAIVKERIAELAKRQQERAARETASEDSEIVEGEVVGEGEEEGAG